MIRKTTATLLLSAALISVPLSTVYATSQTSQTSQTSSNTEASDAKIKLPELPYGYDAMNDYIDAETMEIHYTKHHQAYIDNLLKALGELGGEKKASEYADEDVKEMLMDLDAVTDDEAIKTQIRNNGGGHLNHSMWWKIIGPGKGGEPTGKLMDAIVRDFGSFDAFKEEFNTAATKRFGSGWAWLVENPDGTLEVMSTPNQDNPIMEGKNPILGLDVWEHAYYLKYQNKRPDYIKAFWNIVNWDEAEKLMEQ